VRALLLVAALAASPGEPAPRLPERADVLYRLELAGAAIGVATLSISCAADACEVRWKSAMRVPEEAGGGVVEREVKSTTAPDGTARRIAVRIRADGREHVSHQGAGPAPVGIAEVLLSHAADGERRCIDVQEEETGVEGHACARREGAWLTGKVLGEALRFRAAPGRPADEVLVEAQRARFVADPAARVPERVRSLFGVAADVGPEEIRWCGVDRDAEAGGAAPGEVPRDFPDGASCRERTARYLAAAAARGIEGRHAVGAAFDGTAMVWHEWAELRVGDRWIAVDPSFGQAPARGARFTVARWREGDAASRAEAGRKVLRCWSRE
jgi:hypothetical protein